jgi:hypothetical protein
MEQDKLKKKSPKKAKIYKNTELISLTASGIEQAPENEYNKITPFTESLGKNPPHSDTVKGKLTEGYLWFEIFKKWDIEFFLDNEGFVKGFIKRKRDQKSIENRLTILEGLITKKE